MREKVKRLLVWYLAVSVVITQVILVNPALALSNGNQRLAGSDIYKTAVADNGKDTDEDEQTITPGNYDGYEVRDAYKYPDDNKNQGKAVVYYINCWAVSASSSGVGVYFIGERLHTLVDTSGTEPKIDACLISQDGQGSTIPAVQVTSYDKNGKGIGILFKSESGDTMQGGRYILKVNDSDWNDETSYQCKPVYILCDPYLTGAVTPWVIAKGQSNYTITVDGCNLDMLDYSGKIRFSLIDTYYTRQEYDSTIINASDVTYDKVGNGKISVTFSRKLPVEDDQFLLKAVYIKPDNTEVDLVKGTMIIIPLTDQEVLCEFASDKNAQALKYNLTIRGWNLTGPYTVKITKDGKTIKTIKNIRANKERTQVSFPVTFDEMAEDGSYSIYIYDKVTYAYFFWFINPVLPKIYIEDAKDVFYLSDAEISKVASFDTVIRIENIGKVNLDKLKVKLRLRECRVGENIPSVYEPQLSVDPDDNSRIIAHFNNIAPAVYELAVNFTYRSELYFVNKYPIKVDYGEDKAKVFGMFPWALSSDNTVYHMQYSGDLLDKLIDTSSGEPRIDCYLVKDDNPSQEIPVSHIEAYDVNGRRMQLTFKPYPGCSVQPGMYKLKVNDSDWSDAASFRCDPVYITNNPFLDGAVSNIDFNCGQSNCTFTMSGENLDKLDHSGKIVITVLDPFKSYAPYDWIEIKASDVTHYDSGYGNITVHLNKKLPDHPCDLILVADYIKPENTSINMLPMYKACIRIR